VDCNSDVSSATSDSTSGTASSTAAWTGLLSGGSFQHLRLLATTRRRLEDHGFRVLSHRHVPPNDGGISYGQVAVAAATAS